MFRPFSRPSNIKSLVSNEISFSSVQFHVRLNINYCEIENIYKIYGYKIRQYIFD